MSTFQKIKTTIYPLLLLFTMSIHCVHGSAPAKEIDELIDIIESNSNNINEVLEGIGKINIKTTPAENANFDKVTRGRELLFKLLKNRKISPKNKSLIMENLAKTAGSEKAKIGLKEANEDGNTVFDIILLDKNLKCSSQNKLIKTLVYNVAQVTVEPFPNIINKHYKQDGNTALTRILKDKNVSYDDKEDFIYTWKELATYVKEDINVNQKDNRDNNLITIILGTAAPPKGQLGLISRIGELAQLYKQKIFLQPKARKNMKILLNQLNEKAKKTVKGLIGTEEYESVIKVVLDTQNKDLTDSEEQHKSPTTDKKKFLYKILSKAKENKKITGGSLFVIVASAIYSLRPKKKKKRKRK